MIDLHEIKKEYEKQKIHRDIFQADLDSKRKSLRITSVKIKDYEEVHAIWIALAEKLQRKSREYIEAVVTTAIQTVFEEPYEFKLVFDEKRNNITCTPMIKEGDDMLSPKESEGGAMIDIIGFTLRICLWSMRSPKSRNIFILDEPFRFCGELTLKVASILKQLSKKLNFQVLLITHNTELKEVCDRVWLIRKKKHSQVKMINNIDKIVEKIKRKIKRR